MGDRRIGRGPWRLAFGSLIVMFSLITAACAAGGAISPDARSEVEQPGTGAPVPDADGLGGRAGAEAPRDGALIVRTGTLGLEVGDLAATLRDAQRRIEALGGYVAASDEQNGRDGEESVARVTYRIPVDRWSDGLAAIRGLAKRVVSEQTQSLDVTDQVVDLGARIGNLRASERALVEIMARAQRIEDVLAVQQELTTVREQIERLVAQQSQLRDEAALATLTVQYGTTVVAVTEATRDWDPGSEVDRATAALLDVLQATAAALIWLAIVWLPILVAVGLVALVALSIARRVGIRPPRPSLPGPPAA